MSLNIEIDDDSLEHHIESYVNRAMDRQIKHYLEFQLKDVINAKLTAMALNDPQNSRVEKGIDARILEVLDAHGPAIVKNVLKGLAK